ncbi:hypothetical protein OROMI_002454 [Orobanche minor]
MIVESSCKKMLHSCSALWGQFVPNDTNASYEGGKIRKWDYIQVKNMSVGLIKAYCDDIKIRVVKKIHVRIQNCWKYICSNQNLKESYKECVKDREFHVWIDGYYHSSSDCDYNGDIIGVLDMATNDEDYNENVSNMLTDDIDGFSDHGIESMNGNGSGPVNKSITVGHEDEYDTDSSYGSENIVPASDEDFDSALDSDGSDPERPGNRPKRLPFRA